MLTHRRRQPRTTLYMALFVLVALTIAACGSGRPAGAQERGRPTINPRPPTVAPEYYAKTDADAIRLATDITVQPGKTFASTGESVILQVSSVVWTRSTVAAVQQFFPWVNPQPPAFNNPGSNLGTTVWVFEFTGQFRQYNRTMPGSLGPVLTALYEIATPNMPGWTESLGAPLDLSQLGPVRTVPRGVSPGLDQLRVAEDVIPSPTPTVQTPSPVADTPTVTGIALTPSP